MRKPFFDLVRERVVVLDGAMGANLQQRTLDVQRDWLGHENASEVLNFSRPGGLVPISVDRQAFGIPDHQFTLVATHHIEKFWVSFDLLATSSYLAPVFSNTDFRQYTYRFDGNARADVTAGYTFSIRKNRKDYSIRTFGTIENLFDDEYFENGFRTAGVSARFGVSFGF